MICAPDFFFDKKKRAEQENPKKSHKHAWTYRFPVLRPSQKNLLALRIGTRLKETVTVAVTVRTQLVGQSEGKVRVPVVFGGEVPIMETIVEVPVVVVRVGDGDVVVLVTDAVPKVPLEPGDVPVWVPVPVPVGNVSVPDSVPVRG